MMRANQQISRCVSIARSHRNAHGVGALDVSVLPVFCLSGRPQQVAGLCFAHPLAHILSIKRARWSAQAVRLGRRLLSGTLLLHRGLTGLHTTISRSEAGSRSSVTIHGTGSTGSISSDSRSSTRDATATTEIGTGIRAVKRGQTGARRLRTPFLQQRHR